MVKLASYITPQGRQSFGFVVDGENIVDLASRTEYQDVRSLLNAGNEAILALASHGHDAPDFRISDVEFFPAVPASNGSERKVICVGMNYGLHVAEVRGTAGAPTNPRVFSRLDDTIIGHGAPLIRPKDSICFDYEGELAVVIGTAGRRIPREKALEHVFGYTIFNDGSVRDFQQHSLTAGKNFPSTGPLGPWIVTADEIPDPATLTIETRVNGQVRQHASTGEMIYSVPDLISYVSLVDVASCLILT